MEALPVAVWYVVALVLSALAFPIVTRLFPDWPDRGTGLAPAVGFAVLTITGYWIGQVSFGPHAAVAGVVVLACCGVAAARLDPGSVERPAVTPLAVFTATFLLFVLVRAVDPGIGPYSGEQFLDFGLIHAVRRADVLPPRDIWFAGARLRYYYGGPLLTGLLTFLTDVPPRIAYNLMIPTVFASLSTAAYSVVSAIAADRDLPARAAGVLGVFFVAFAGPAATAIRAASSYVPRDLAAEYGRVLYRAIPASYPESVEAGRYLAGGEFDYWLGRYLVPGTPNVFPFWTFFNGDLRPHMYAAPLVLLAVGVAFAYYRTPTDRVRRRRALLFGALPVVGGVLAFTNTFDLPVVVGLAWLTAYFGDADPGSLLPRPLSDRLPTTDRSTGIGEISRALVAVCVAGVVAALSGVLASPFLLFHTADHRGIVLLGPTTGLGGLLLVYGGFLLAFGLAFVPRVVDGWPRRRRLALVGVLLAALLVTALVGYPAVGLFAPLIAGGWWLTRTDRETGFDVVLVVAGAGLVLVPEFAYLAVWPYDPNAPRWNTVYKIAMQVWLVWGVAAAVALVRVFGRVRGCVGIPDGIRDRRQTVVAVTAVVLVVVFAAFPAFALWSKLDRPLAAPAEADLSLNGTGYLWEVRTDRVASARWLRTETTGQPTMVSKPTNVSVYSYDAGANVPATFSGVPTIAGWEHAAGYHGRENYEIAVSHAVAIYRADWAVACHSLRYFDVRYIYLGPAERDAYGSRDFASLSPAIDVAYRRGNVTIYRVNSSQLGCS